MKSPETILCMFYHCKNEAVGEPWGKTGTGKRFCKKHDAECRKAWNTSAHAVMAFWLKAGGGARRMADSM